MVYFPSTVYFFRLEIKYFFLFLQLGIYDSVFINSVPCPLGFSEVLFYCYYLVTMGGNKVNKVGKTLKSFMLGCTLPTSTFYETINGQFPSSALCILIPCLLSAAVCSLLPSPSQGKEPATDSLGVSICQLDKIVQY